MTWLRHAWRAHGECAPVHAAPRAHGVRVLQAIQQGVRTPVHEERRGSPLSMRCGGGTRRKAQSPHVRGYVPPDYYPRALLFRRFCAAAGCTHKLRATPRVSVRAQRSGIPPSAVCPGQCAWRCAIEVTWQCVIIYFRAPPRYAPCHALRPARCAHACSLVPPAPPPHARVCVARCRTLCTVHAGSHAASGRRKRQRRHA